MSLYPLPPPTVPTLDTLCGVLAGLPVRISADPPFVVSVHTPRALRPLLTAVVKRALEDAGLDLATRPDPRTGGWCFLLFTAPDESEALP